MEKGDTKKREYYNHGDFIRVEASYETEVQAKMRDAAYTLRKAILEAKRTPRLQDLKIEDIVTGEITIPGPLLHFFADLTVGLIHDRVY